MKLLPGNDRTATTAGRSRAGLRRTRRLRVAVLAGLVGAAVAACKSSTNVSSVVPIPGTFGLVLVNDAPLPYLEADSTTYVVRGSIDIKNNERYDFVETDSSAGVASDSTSSGYWVASGNAMALHDDNGTVYPAALSARWDTVRVQFGTHLDTFVRQ